MESDRYIKMAKDILDHHGTFIRPRLCELLPLMCVAIEYIEKYAVCLGEVCRCYNFNRFHVSYIMLGHLIL